MGFDIYGEASERECGEYFRNNVWWWRPLSGIIESLCDHVLDDDQKRYLHTNDGCLYDNQTAKDIADILEENEDRWEGIAKIVQAELQFHLKDGSVVDYPYDASNVKEFIQFARYSGGFKIC